jgi:O-succinylbenzoic acid--CoA ligase
MRDWLAAQRIARPDGIALINGAEQWTFLELDRLVSVLCGRLAGLGVQSRTVVGILMPNLTDNVVLIHALARLGAVLLPLNTRLTAAELDWMLMRAQCTLLICSQATEATAAELSTMARRVVSVDESNDPRVQSWWDITLTDSWRPVELDMNAVQAIMFTSGTTGTPKGVQLTFGNHFFSAMGSAYRIGTQPDDRWLCNLPLYHVGGLAIILRAALYGITVVLQDGFDLDALNVALDTQRVTLMSLVPTMLFRLLNARETYPPSLRLVLVGGAAASPDLVQRAVERGVPIATTYGLTEAASQVATMLPAEVVKKPGSVGKPLMLTSVKIVDEGGKPLKAGEIGEVIVNSPVVMQSYLAYPPCNGELRTGDMGYLDKDGDLWLVDRRSDLIVTGGENVYPSEVENTLRQHPAVYDVCVVGLPDAEWGQRVAAMIVVREGQRLTIPELMQFSRGRLAGYKQPRVVVFTDHLPHTASGKIHRAAVVEELLSNP